MIICFYSREYWMIYRGPGFLDAIRLLLRPSPPVSRQQVVSLSQSSCVLPVELTDGRRGWVRSLIIRPQQSFNTLCTVEYTVHCTYVPKYLRKWRKEDWRGALWQFPSSYPRWEQVPAACKQTRWQKSNHVRFCFLRKRFVPTLWLTDRKKAVNQVGYLIKR